SPAFVPLPAISAGRTDSTGKLVQSCAGPAKLPPRSFTSTVCPGAAPCGDVPLTTGIAAWPNAKFAALARQQNVQIGTRPVRGDLCIVCFSVSAGNFNRRTRVAWKVREERSSEPGLEEEVFRWGSRGFTTGKGRRINTLLYAPS